MKDESILDYFISSEMAVQKESNMLLHHMPKLLEEENYIAEIKAYGEVDQNKDLGTEIEVQSRMFPPTIEASVTKSLEEQDREKEYKTVEKQPTRQKENSNVSRDGKAGGQQKNTNKTNILQMDDQNEQNLNAFMARRRERQRSQPPQLTLKEQQKRLAVTKFSLAYWYAQTFNLDLNSLPVNTPDHLDKNAFHDIRLNLQGFMQREAPEQKVWTALNEADSLISEEDEEREQSGKKTQNFSNFGIKSQDKEWMKNPARLKPYLYPASRKNLRPALELPIENLPDYQFLKEDLQAAQRKKVAQIKLQKKQTSSTTIKSKEKQIEDSNQAILSVPQELQAGVKSNQYSAERAGQLFALWEEQQAEGRVSFNLDEDLFTENLDRKELLDTITRAKTYDTIASDDNQADDQRISTFATQGHQTFVTVPQEKLAENTETAKKAKGGVRENAVSVVQAQSQNTRWKPKMHPPPHIVERLNSKELRKVLTRDQIGHMADRLLKHNQVTTDKKDDQKSIKVKRDSTSTVGETVEITKSATYTPFECQINQRNKSQLHKINSTLNSTMQAHKLSNFPGVSGTVKQLSVVQEILKQKIKNVEAPQKKAEVLGTGLIGRNANRFTTQKRLSIQGKVNYDDNFLIRQGVTYSDKMNKKLHNSSDANPYSDKMNKKLHNSSDTNPYRKNDKSQAVNFMQPRYTTSLQVPSGPAPRFSTLTPQPLPSMNQKTLKQYLSTLAPPTNQTQSTKNSMRGVLSAATFGGILKSRPQTRDDGRGRRFTPSPGMQDGQTFSLRIGRENQCYKQNRQKSLNTSKLGEVANPYIQKLIARTHGQPTAQAEIMLSAATAMQTEDETYDFEQSLMRPGMVQPFLDDFGSSILSEVQKNPRYYLDDNKMVRDSGIQLFQSRIGSRIGNARFGKGFGSQLSNRQELSTDLAMPNMSIELAPSFYMSKIQQRAESSVQQFSTDGALIDFIPQVPVPPNATPSCLNLSAAQNYLDSAMFVNSTCAKEQSQKFIVSEKEYNMVVTEPASFFMPEFVIQLKLHKPASDQKAVGSDIFKHADFWQRKGFKIQLKAELSKARDEKLQTLENELFGDDQDEEEEPIRPDQIDFVAQDYYLSGVKVEQGHFGCIYNIGRCYFNTYRYANAKRWFKLAIKANPYCPDSYYALSASCLKLSQFEEAREIIRLIDVIGAQRYDEEKNKGQASRIGHKHLDQNETYFKVKPDLTPSENYCKEDFVLMHAICCKILRDNKEASRLYQKLDKQIRIEYQERIVCEVFGMINLMLLKDRRQLEDHLYNLHETLQLFSPNDQYSQEITNFHLSDDYDFSVQDEGKVESILSYLKILPFFRRFSKKKMKAGGYFKDMKRITFKEKEILLMPEKDLVYILINGKVIMREHNTKEPIKIKIKQICKPGHILGVDQMDGGISNLPYVWGSVQTKLAEFIQVKRSTFEKMWYDFQINKKEVMIGMLQEYKFFAALSVQTQYRILYETGRSKNFTAGERVVQIHQRSPWNPTTEVLYQVDELFVPVPIDQRRSAYKGMYSVLKSKKSYAFQATELQIRRREHERRQLGNSSVASQDSKDFQIAQPPVETKPIIGFVKKLCIALNEKIVNVGGSYSQMNPVLFILSGSAIVKNPLLDETNEKVYELGVGEVIGDSDLLRYSGIDFFGDIYAGEHGLQCLVLPAPEQVIDEFEIPILLKIMEEKYSGLQLQLQNHHPVLGHTKITKY